MSEIYEQLTAPFAHTFKKPGSNLDYITGEQVTSRLNESLGWDGWSFRVLEHGYDEAADEFWCLGELTAVMPTTTACISKQQFGSQKPNRYKATGAIIDLGFDLKGAATDALKKCASLIGVGLYLHEKESSQPIAKREAPPSSPLTQQAFDSERLMALMAEFGIKGEDLAKVTGVSPAGKPQPKDWLSKNPGKTIDDLVSLAVDTKQAALAT